MPSTIGQLRQVCERWIYSACLYFALSTDEQSLTHFQYQYAIYQVELSRNLIFHKGGQMEQLFESLVDRLRPVLDLKRIKTIFGQTPSVSASWPQSTSVGGCRRDTYL